MKKIVLASTLALALLQLSACTVTRQESGAMMGAVVGGVVGNQVGGGHGKDIATAIGMFAGALAGSSIGKSLDQLDAANTQQALENGRTNQTTSWTNPDSGNDYSVTPTKTYQTTAGRYCREYQSSVNVGGQRERGYGTACRQEDGSWEIL